MESWIKINRKLLEWEWFDDPYMVKAWLLLLLQANYEDKKWRGLVIRRGQLVTSISQLACSVGCSMKQVRTILTRLEESECIGKQTTNKYTIITICNYDAYQSSEEPEGQTKGKQRANEGQTKGNNIRNKEIKNIDLDSIDIESLSEAAEPSRPKAEPVEWVRLMFNEICVDYSKVSSLSEKRVNKVRLRLEEMRKLDPNSGVLSVVLEKMQASKFLKGDNHRGWKATFDWLFDNPTNWVKVYEGNYDDRGPQNRSSTTAQPKKDRVSGFDEVNLNKQWE